MPDWNKDNAVWRNYIRLSENPLIEDHRVSGEILYPAAGMLVMAVEASRQIAEKDKVLKGFRFRDVSFHLALRVPEDAVGIESHFYLRPYRESTLPIRVVLERIPSMHLPGWPMARALPGFGTDRIRARNCLAAQYPEDQLVREDCDQQLEKARAACSSTVPSEKIYRAFRDSGLISVRRSAR